jgi:hypothetical protein
VTAVLTIPRAVDAAILADATIMAILVDRGVYAAGDVPQGQRVDNSNEVDPPTRIGYVRIDSSGEVNDPMFATDAHDGTLSLSIQSNSKDSGGIIYRELYRVLNGKTLPPEVTNPDSVGLVEGTLTYVEDFPDPTGSHNTIARYGTATVSLA